MNLTGNTMTYNGNVGETVSGLHFKVINPNSAELNVDPDPFGNADLTTVTATATDLVFSDGFTIAAANVQVSGLASTIASGSFTIGEVSVTIPANQVSGTLNFVAGKWNLVTTPIPANMPTSELSGITSKTIWAFDSNAYQYTAAGDSLEVGKGYWVKADVSGGAVTYSAVPTVESKDAQWNIIQGNLVSGTWNLVGTSFDTNKTEVKDALGVNAVWPFDAEAYQYSTDENIAAGKGFWVK